MKVTAFTLEDIAEIASPLTYRGRFVESPKGNVRLLSIKDLISMSSLNAEVLPLVEAEKPSSRIAIADGDILMPARGLSYPARIVSNLSETILTTGQIHVIRARLVDPHYLIWFLNRKSTQEKIAMQLTGSTIQSFKKSDLQRLEVQVPSIDIQKVIGEIDQLKLRKNIAQQELNAVEAAEIDAVCASMIEREHGDVC
jgi:restriction endonuclease S subunit